MKIESIEMPPGGWRLLAFFQPPDPIPGLAEDAGVAIAIRRASKAAHDVHNVDVEFVVWTYARGGFANGDYGFDADIAWSEFSRRAGNLFADALPAMQDAAYPKKVYGYRPGMPPKEAS